MPCLTKHNWCWSAMKTNCHRSGCAVWQTLQSEGLHQRFGQASIRLQEVYRNRGDLARLSNGLAKTGRNPSGKACRPGGRSNVKPILTPSTQLPDSVLQAIHQRMDALNKASQALSISASEPDPHHAHALLEQLDSLMVLCPRRRGLWGVETLHRQLVTGQGPDTWPEGLPVLCSDNQTELGSPMVISASASAVEPAAGCCSLQ